MCVFWFRFLRVFFLFIQSEPFTHYDSVHFNCDNLIYTRKVDLQLIVNVQIREKKNWSKGK